MNPRTFPEYTFKIKSHKSNDPYYVNQFFDVIERNSVSILQKHLCAMPSVRARFKDSLKQVTLSYDPISGMVNRKMALDDQNALATLAQETFALIRSGIRSGKHVFFILSQMKCFLELKHLADMFSYLTKAETVSAPVGCTIIQANVIQQMLDDLVYTSMRFNTLGTFVLNLGSK